MALNKWLKSKRKAVTKLTLKNKDKATSKRKGTSTKAKPKEDIPENLDENMQLVPHSSETVTKKTKKKEQSVRQVILKKPAAASRKADNSEAEDDVGEVQKATKASSDKDMTAAREKELKAMPARDLKELLSTRGLALGVKDAMIKTLLKYETKERGELRAHESKIRAVVLSKKDELEAKSAPALKDLCAAIGVTGALPKEERIKHLLAHWQENDGVDKALSKIALDERRQELSTMEKDALHKLCTKRGVDPHVQEILVDRIVKKETESGRFVRPAVQEERVPEVSKKGGDLVDDLLAQEAAKKKEKEQQQQAQAAAMDKIRKLKDLSIEQLKKQVAKKGVSADGTKQGMIKALFAQAQEETALETRRAQLKSMSKEELKTLLSNKGLSAGGSRDDMVKCLLEQEARIREQTRVFEGKISEALVKQKQDFERESGAALKALCLQKGLKAGVTKEDRIERLLEEARNDGSVDRIASAMIRNLRKQELVSMSKAALLELCDETGVDPLVQEIMVERLLSHEQEEDTVEPASKKSRSNK